MDGFKRGGATLSKQMNPTCILAVVTARGGSKGIPGKNTVPLAGKPLIAWTIEAATAARSVSRVVVSTDSEEIARVSRKWGAEVPFLRPPELARDDSPHVPVVIHAVQWMERHEGLKPDYVLLLQPTSPLRTAEDVDSVCALAAKKDADSVVSVCEASQHPYLMKTVLADGRMKDFIPKPEGYLRRQDLPLAYLLNGSIYLVKRNILLSKQTFYTDRTFAFVMPIERSLDIDAPADLQQAEAILKAR